MKTILLSRGLAILIGVALLSCQPENPQAKQRIQELLAENASYKAQLETLSKQMQEIAANTAAVQQKIDTFLQTMSAPVAPTRSEPDISVPVSKLVETLKAKSVDIQITGFPKSATAVLVLQGQGSASTISVPFAQNPGSDAWEPLMTDTQILATLGNPSARPGELPQQNLAPAGSKRPPPIHIGGDEPRETLPSARPSQSSEGGAKSSNPIRVGNFVPDSPPTTPNVPSPQTTEPTPVAPTESESDSLDGKTIPHSQGGPRVIEKQGRKVIRLQP